MVTSDAFLVQRSLDHILHTQESSRLMNIWYLDALSFKNTETDKYYNEWAI